MNAAARPSIAPDATAAPVAMLRTLVVCDLVDSTRLVGAFGDQRAADLFRKHDRMARALLAAHGGREIDKTDGFLLMFDRPVQATAFALDYLRELRELGVAESAPLGARVGVHVGDVVAWDNAAADIARGAKPIEVEGLVKAIASRLMQLALPNQILLSGVAHAFAHRAQGELGERLQTLRWRTHGRYRFKGVPDPVPVFEVGEEGFAPLKAPPWSGKAHREVPFWRRPATLGIELVALFMLLAAPAWYLLSPAPAIAFAQRDWVVVGDLKNLTGDTRFDEAVETAFRIGLEQSRYVNVLSDLKARETIGRMQRDAGRTPIDRAIGAEIAIRDGARALILPTVAEIGDRVRVTVEVIDPGTQTTVYSESVDGTGAESLLDSLDTINRRLRVRLGEALATVSGESRPLAQVATPNLDALRAYTLGDRAYNGGNYNDAIAFYRQALKLDGDFALARIGLARMLLVADRRAEAVSELDRVLGMHEHLPPRDAAFADAWRSSLTGAQAEAIDKWRVVARLYPDFFAAQGLFAFFGWEYANRFDTEVVEAARAASSERNPNAPASQLLLGMLELGNERPDEATRAFDAARSGGMQWHFDYALPHAALRRFDAAEAVLARATPTGVAGGDIDAHATRIAIAFDRGAFDEGRKRIDTAQREGAAGNVDYARFFRGLDLGVTVVLDPGESKRPALREHAAALKQAIAKAVAGEAVDLRFELAFTAWLAARTGDAKLARLVLADVGSGLAATPLLQRMATVAEAETERAEGRSLAAIDRLKATLDGTELCIAHVTLMEALAEQGNNAAALEQADWLVRHRGHAYAEYNSRQLLLPLNVIESTLAQLRAAELQQALGRGDAARASLAAFRKAWPNATGNAPIAQRIRSLGTDR